MIFAMGPLVLLLLVVLLAVLVRVFSRRGGWGMRVRRVRKRHLLTRVICGTLGAAIVIAVAVGTYKSVQEPYALEQAGDSPVVVRVPAKPLPPLPPVTSYETATIEKARLLIHVIHADPWLPLRVLHVQEFEIDYPRDRGQRIEKSFELGDGHYTFALTVDLLQSFKRPDGSLHLRGLGSVSGTWKSDHGTWSSGFADFEDIRPLTWGPEMPGSRSPLSVIPSPQETRRVLSYMTATIVAPDDPLKEVTQAEFAASSPVPVERQEPSPTFNLNYRPRMSAAPGAELVKFTGVSALLLLVAAILLTQLFVRRRLAFAGLLAAMVLYVAALDRLALRTNVGYLNDSSASTAARVIACTRTAQTFLYRNTAMKALDTIAGSKDAPAPLRDAARMTASDLRRER